MFSETVYPAVSEESGTVISARQRFPVLVDVLLASLEGSELVVLGLSVTVALAPGLAAAVADRPCLCVGTLVGMRVEVARLSRLILSLAATPRSEIGGAFGADQAAFNLAVHQGLVSSSIRPNYGRVATLG